MDAETGTYALTGPAATVIWVYLGALGACVGSFLNVVIYRLPLEKSIVRPGSSCPRCSTPIRWFDNVPMISFLVLGGKCRKCGEKISLRYPAVEFASMMIVLIDYYFFGLSWQLPIVSVLSLGMLAVALIDFDHMIIPDELSIGGAALGLAAAFVPGGAAPLDAFIGAAVGSGALGLIRYVHMKMSGVEGMGLGDVKLAATIGAFVGWQGLAPVFFASSITGLIIGGGYILIKGKETRTPIPFGTFLALGTVVYATGAVYWTDLLTKTAVFVAPIN